MKNKNVNCQNLGYAGFFFKKTLQPYSLRIDNIKTANEFKDKNIIMYINQKFREIRKRMGKNEIPKPIFLQSVLQTKSTKPDIHKILVQEIVDENAEKNKDLNKQKQNITMNKLNKEILEKIGSKKKKDFFFFESKGAPRKREIKKFTETNPEKKIRTILHDKINEEEVNQALSEYNKLRLKRKFLRLKNDKNFEKVDFNKKFLVINQLIQNEDDPLETYFFMTEVCKKNNLDLKNLMNLNDENLKLIENEIELDVTNNDLSMISKNSKKLDKKKKKKISYSEINNIINNEEENQQKKLIEIFKQTHEDNAESDLKMTAANKRQNFQENLYREMEDYHKDEILKILRKKTEINEQRFVRNSKKFFVKDFTLKKKYFEKFGPIPTTTKAIFHRPTTSSITTATFGTQKTQPNSRIRTKSEIKATTVTSPNFNLKTISFDNKNLEVKPLKQNFKSLRPKSEIKIINSIQSPNSLNKQKNLKIPKNPISPKNSNSLKSPKSLKGPQSPKSPKSPKSNFFQEIDKNKIINYDNFDNENKKNFHEPILSPKSPRLILKNKNIGRTDERTNKIIKEIKKQKKEKANIIKKFDNFFFHCDLENRKQITETETVNENLTKFDGDLKRIQKKAKTLTNFGDMFIGSEENFNQMKNRFKFKKRIIDYLLEKISDKSDLLSMYNKYIAMEENIHSSLKIT